MRVSLALLTTLVVGSLAQVSYAPGSGQPQPQQGQQQQQVRPQVQLRFRPADIEFTTPRSDVTTFRPSQRDFQQRAFQQPAFQQQEQHPAFQQSQFQQPEIQQSAHDFSGGRSALEQRQLAAIQQQQLASTQSQPQFQQQQLEATQNRPQFRRPVSAPQQLPDARLGRLSDAQQFDQFDPRDQFRGPPPGQRQFGGQQGHPGLQQQQQQQQQQAPPPPPARGDRSKSRFKSIAYDESDGEGSFDYTDEEGGAQKEEASPDRLAELLAISTFKCDPTATGYYADDSVDCAVFHYCTGGVKHSWVCPDGQSFHQINLICQPHSADNICKRTKEFHFVNDFLYKQVNNDSSKPEYADRFSLDPLEISQFVGDPNGIDQFRADPSLGRPQAGLQQPQQPHQQQPQQPQQQRGQQRVRQRVRRPRPDVGQQADFGQQGVPEPNIPKQQADFQPSPQDFGGPQHDFRGPQQGGQDFRGPQQGGPNFGGPQGIPPHLAGPQGFPPGFGGPQGGRPGLGGDPRGGLGSNGPHAQGGRPDQPTLFRPPQASGFNPSGPSAGQFRGPPQGFGPQGGLQNLGQLRNFAQQREGQLGGGVPGHDQQLLDRPSSPSKVNRQQDSQQDESQAKDQFTHGQQGGRPDLGGFRQGPGGPGGFQPGFSGPGGPGQQGNLPQGFDPRGSQHPFGPGGPPRGGPFGGPQGGPQGIPAGFIDPRLVQQGQFSRGGPPGGFRGPQISPPPGDIPFGGVPTGFSGPSGRQLRGIALGGSEPLQGRPPRSSSPSDRSEDADTAANGVQYIDASQLRQARRRQPVQRFRSPQGPQPSEAHQQQGQQGRQQGRQLGNPFPQNDIKPQLRFTGEPPHF